MARQTTKDWILNLFFREKVTDNIYSILDRGGHGCPIFNKKYFILTF